MGRVSGMHNSTEGRLALFALVGGAVFAGTAAAQGAGMIETGGIPVGQGLLYPSVTIEETYDDNIFLQQTNTIDSWITTVSPRVVFEQPGEFRGYRLEGGVSKGIFHNSSGDNFTDADISGVATYTPNNRITTTMGAGYLMAHDERGSGDSRGAAATAFPHPDEFHEWNLFGRYEYGLKEMFAPRFSVELSHTDTEYDNNRARTASNDLAENFLRGTFSYMVMPNTSLELEGVVSDVDYDTANSDNTKYKLLAGASWDATYQTTGFAKVGKQKIDFDNGTNVDGLAWEIGVDWSPLSYSTFNLSSSRDTTDSSGIGVGSSTETTTNKISWRHHWKSYLESRVFYELKDEDFLGTTREDQTDTFKVEIEYAMRNWLHFGLNLMHQEASSTAAGFSFDNNVLNLTAKIGL